MLSLLNIDDRATSVAAVLWPRIETSETTEYSSEDDLATAVAALVTQVRDDVMGADSATYGFWQHAIPITAYADVMCQIERVGKNWRYALYLIERTGDLILTSKVLTWREKPFDA